jgi:hypothetical protein
VVVWVPSGEPGWDLEQSIPYDTPFVPGGIRSLYEIAAALASVGRRVELRGVVSLPAFHEVCEQAGAWPELPDTPRRPAASDTVIVPEGVEDPALHARVALSPARTVLMMLGPPGLVGWPFTENWSPPDSITVDLDSVARPEHFRGAASLGYELWTHTPGLQRAALEAGVPCQLLGNGVPGGYPAPPATKDLDVVWLPANRWAPLAEPVVRTLSERGVQCTGLSGSSQREVLDFFGRALVLVHPMRIEGHSRIACEARAMGAVPVVLASNRFGVGLEEPGGTVVVEAVSEMADAVIDLLGAPERVKRLSAAGMRSARDQVDWHSFVERVDAALATDPDQRGSGARAGLGTAMQQLDRDNRTELKSLQAELDSARAEAERHGSWLRSTQASTSWRATAPFRAARRAVRRQARS